jgi:hypothetical protein
MAAPAAAAPPTAKPPAPPTPPAAPAPPPPRTGAIADHGAVRRDSLRAQKWSAQGAAKILGDVEIDEAELRGMTSIKGKLSGGTVSSSGNLEVGGAVDLTGLLRVDGETVLRGAAKLGGLEVKGAFRVGTTLTVAGEMRWSGRLETGGDIAAGPVAFEGRLDTPGELRAVSLNGHLKGGTSRCTVVRADLVVLRRMGMLGPAGAMTVQEIEGRHVEVEGVTAERIRAKEVVIGPGCQIAYVEGTVLSIHRSSHVGPVSRSPPPHGLFR